MSERTKTGVTSIFVPISARRGGFPKEAVHRGAGDPAVSQIGVLEHFTEREPTELCHSGTSENSHALPLGEASDHRVC